MTDYSLPSSVTLAFGQSGSGKTTYAMRHLINAVVACRFVFDWKQIEIATRLSQKSVSTLPECEAALASRYVCFNPMPAFGSDLDAGLRWFAGWALNKSRQGSGLKLFYCDELWKFCDARNDPPPEVEDIVRGIGRPEGLQFLTSTQHPRDYHRNIRAEVTEWICFQTKEPGDLDAVRPYYPGVDKVAALPRGEFIVFNRDSGAERQGRVF